MINTIKIGDTFKNYKGDIYIIEKISKTGLIIHAKNFKTSSIDKFRFYETSGKYIKDKTLTTELGEKI